MAAQASQAPQASLPPNANTTIRSRPNFLLFGDSLTERSFDPSGGWGAALAHMYTRKADVINRGFGGYNSRMAVHLLPHIFSEEAVRNTILATIFLGANDAAKPAGGSSRQHVPVQQYGDNLRTIVKHVRDVGVQNIILIAPPPVVDARRVSWQRQKEGNSNLEVQPDRTNAFTREYAKACCTVAQELQVPCIDLWTQMQQDSNWQDDYLLLSDGLHLAPAGNLKVFELLKGSLAESFPQLHVDKLPWHFPWWGNVDPEHPDVSFRAVK